jgi:6-pyruvoyltetrahydropterin/6-carboxytetrahydropterin synthase
MRKVTVVKEFTWDMAHMLAGHEGLCKNLHGHTYRMQVEVSRLDGDLVVENGNSQGMVVDFKILKDLVKGKIIKPLDHAFMYWKESTDEVEHEIARLLKKNGKKVVEVSYRPTAEEMALNFFDELSKEMEACSLELCSIKIWETPTSFAEVKKEYK